MHMGTWNLSRVGQERTPNFNTLPEAMIRLRILGETLQTALVRSLGLYVKSTSNTPSSMRGDNQGFEERISFLMSLGSAESAGIREMVILGMAKVLAVVRRPKFSFKDFAIAITSSFASSFRMTPPFRVLLARCMSALILLSWRKAQTVFSL